ncbi:Hypothetical predicted protein [Octopus vulgaris]|uniref:Uncharacterized protein n=1 Tax=Octopus vulgaris TaxID=6645 RepID=A0AA36C1S3_OCTVU|nr:Hypothetical predicted protein [Octopus vulgaris]
MSKSNLIKNAAKSNGVCAHVNKAFSNDEDDAAGGEPTPVENDKDSGGTGAEAHDSDDDDDEEIGKTSQAGSAATSLNSTDDHHIGSLECREMERMRSYSDTSCHDDDNDTAEV